MPAQKPKTSKKKNGKPKTQKGRPGGAQKPLKNIRESAAQAALSLAAEQGWAQVDFPAIAARADVDLADLREHFEDKADIIAAYGRSVDRRISEGADFSDAGISPRDRLFDLLMERLDILNENREGVKAVISSFRCDPKQGIIGLPHLGRSMSRMLETAGIGTDGLRGAARVAGLTGVYLKTLRSWAEDDSADLSPTMADLDKNLDRAERVAALLRLDGLDG